MPFAFAGSFGLQSWDALRCLHQEFPHPVSSLLVIFPVISTKLVELAPREPERTVRGADSLGLPFPRSLARPSCSIFGGGRFGFGPCRRAHRITAVRICAFASQVKHSRA